MDLHFTCSECMILIIKQRMLKEKVNEYSKFVNYNLVPIEAQYDKEEIEDSLNKESKNQDIKFDTVEDVLCE